MTRETFETMRLHVQLDDAIRREAKVEWQPSSGTNPMSGTIRHGVWTPELQLSRADPRDGCIRITTRSGMEMTMAWPVAVDLLRNSLMALD